MCCLPHACGVYMYVHLHSYVYFRYIFWTIYILFDDAQTTGVLGTLPKTNDLCYCKLDRELQTPSAINQRFTRQDSQGNDVRQGCTAETLQTTHVFWWLGGTFVRNPCSGYALTMQPSAPYAFGKVRRKRKTLEHSLFSTGRVKRVVFFVNFPNLDTVSSLKI